MNICIIGTGYVGLVTAVVLADLGNRVIGVDNDEKKIQLLGKGVVPIYEPGLEELLKKNMGIGRISFSTDISEGVKNALVIFICVNTPPKPDGEADLTAVARVSRVIAETMEEYKVIVDKSTVPVQTGEKVAETIRRYNKKGIEFDVVSNPEFLREGSAVYDSFHPDRIVVGTDSQKAAEIMVRLYKPLSAPILITDIKSAELIKHASNSFLAMKISYANALANICERTGADINRVVEGMGLDKRIGRAFLNAGIGYGGSCFPKDVSAFIKIAEKVNYDFNLLKAVQEINYHQRKEFVKKVKEVLWVVSDKTIGVLGLAFKPDTDDMRNAPSIDIIRMLREEGATVKAYDPKAMEKAKQVLPDIIYCDDPYQVADGSDALLILTEWDEFKKLDYSRIKGLLTHPILLDGRNLLDMEYIRELGFLYKGVGRG